MDLTKGLRGSVLVDIRKGIIESFSPSLKVSGRDSKLVVTEKIEHVTLSIFNEGVRQEIGFEKAAISDENKRRGRCRNRYCGGCHLDKREYDLPPEFRHLNKDEIHRGYLEYYMESQVVTVGLYHKERWNLIRKTFLENTLRKECAYPRENHRLSSCRIVSLRVADVDFVRAVNLNELF